MIVVVVVVFQTTKLNPRVISCLARVLPTAQKSKRPRRKSHYVHTAAISSTFHAFFFVFLFFSLLSSALYWTVSRCLIALHRKVVWEAKKKKRRIDFWAICVAPERARAPLISIRLIRGLIYREDAK